MTQRSSLILTAALLVPSVWAQAAGRQERLPWADLQARIAGRKVALVLPGGTHVEGKVLGVEPDGLRLNISKSSDKKAQPKGKQVIPRQAVSVLHVTEYRRIGRVLGTLGAVGLAGGIVAAQQIDLYEGALTIAVPAGIAAGMAGSAIGGYYVGKAFDKKVTEIYVEPAPTSPGNPEPRR